MSWSAYVNPTSVLDRSLACLGAGEQRGRFGPMGPRRLSTHGLVIVSRGHGSYCGVADLPVTAPALIWLFPGVEHAYAPGAEGWSEHWVLFRGQVCSIYDQLGFWAVPRPVVALPFVPPGLGSLFSTLKSTLSTPSLLGHLSASVLTQQLLLAALTAAASGGGQGDRTRRVVADFAADALTVMPMAERAHRLGVSLAELRIMLKSETGHNPQDYLLQIRLSAAQSSLARTPLTVAQIAQQVGFGDPAYFSRCFSAKIGMTPSAFRHLQAHQQPE